MELQCLWKHNFYKNVFNFSEEEIKNLEKELVQDQKQKFRFEQISVEGNDPQDSGEAVGTPSDILGAVKRGVDMFDCVLPTRSGRTGLAFTWNGRINIRNAKYKNDNSPLDKSTTNFELNKYSKNYLNHLFNTNEMLGSMLLTLNNINFYQELMSSIRINIKRGTFSKFHDKYISIL